MLRRLLTVFGLVAVAACARAAEAPSTLTDQEKQTGWRLLFDGKSTKGWMTIEGKPLPSRHVQETALNPHPCDYMLISDQPYKNYELSLDFKITPKCNGGVFVRTFPLTVRPGRDIGMNGIEIAIDDTKSAGLYDSGAIYDLVKPTKNAMKPAGQWNRMKVISDGPLLTVALNGELVSRMNFDEWTEPNMRPDGSAHKFDTAYKDHPRKGYIGLQDHGSDCWFRNIKLRPLP